LGDDLFGFFPAFGAALPSSAGAGGYTAAAFALGLYGIRRSNRLGLFGFLVVCFFLLCFFGRPVFCFGDVDFSNYSQASQGVAFGTYGFVFDFFRFGLILFGRFGRRCFGFFLDFYFWSFLCFGGFFFLCCFFFYFFFCFFYLFSGLRLCFGFGLGFFFFWSGFRFFFQGFRSRFFLDGFCHHLGFFHFGGCLGLFPHSIQLQLLLSVWPLSGQVIFETKIQNLRGMSLRASAPQFSG